MIISNLQHYYLKYKITSNFIYTFRDHRNFNTDIDYVCFFLKMVICLIEKITFQNRTTNFSLLNIGFPNLSMRYTEIYSLFILKSNLTGFPVFYLTTQNSIIKTNKIHEQHLCDLFLEQQKENPPLKTALLFLKHDAKLFPSWTQNSS